MPSLFSDIVMDEVPTDFPPGMGLVRGALSAQLIERLAVWLGQGLTHNHFYQPVTRGGGSMSVWIASFGELGWVSDRQGYRYQVTHPTTHQAWPPIGDDLTELWQGLRLYQASPPQACVVNYYGKQAKMGLHQDLDEGNRTAPVVSLSLGDPGLFIMPQAGERLTSKQARMRKFWLYHGDVMWFGGAARDLVHGVDKIDYGHGPNWLSGQCWLDNLPHLPPAMRDGRGRWNITLRVVR